MTDSASRNANKSSASDGLSTNEAYDILSDRRRRYTIHHLKQAGKPVSVRELAEQVAAWENDKPIERLDAQERKRVYVSLYQSHLQTLDKKDIVEYDDEESVVTLTDSVEKADLYVEVVSDSNIPWGFFYFGLTVAFSFTLALTWANIGVFEQVSTMAVSVVAAGAYGVAAIAQAFQQRRSKLGDDGPPPEIN